MSEKSLMKIAADLGISFSVVKIIDDRLRSEYDDRLRAADNLCQAAKEIDWTNIKLMLGYMKDKGISWPHADGQLRIFIEIVRKAIAEYERKGD